jgi:Ca-activated chloride channel family protein
MEGNWFSLKWFTPEIWNSFDWEAPIWFYGLLLIPIIILIQWLLNLRYKKFMPVALTKKDLKSDPISLLRFFPPILFYVFFSLIVVAMARPQITNEQVEQWSEGIDIMMLIDISQSMQIQDFRPNRLEAAKDVARDFVDGRF